MIVLITSLTPRVTLSSAAMPAQAAPTTIATIRVIAIRRNPGSELMKARTGHRRGQHRGQPVLAVDADVEQVHLEADGDRDRGQVVHRASD